MNGAHAQWGKAAMLLAALLALVVWWSLPAPKPPRQAPALDEEWALPTLQMRNPEKSLSTLTVIAPWGKTAVAPGAAGAAGQPVEVLNDPEWRFEGVTVHGDQRLVLIRVAGQPVASLKEGDSLPGGAKIVHIHEDSLCLLINGKKRNLDIFQ